MLPRDNLWELVQKHDENLFADADHRVGIQVRFLYERKVYFQGTRKRANDHVKQCVAENNILPNIGELQTKGGKGRVIQVSVISLHTALSEELVKIYNNLHRNVTVDMVRITQLTHRGKQGFSADEDQMAMVEVLLLSFVDELLVTPWPCPGPWRHPALVCGGQEEWPGMCPCSVGGSLLPDLTLSV